MRASSPGRPVLVIGAGPVGQTAALLLARWGVPVILLDRRPARDGVGSVSGSRAICQQRDVLDVWESVGAGARIAAEGLTWSLARTFHRDRELFSYPVADPGASEFPAFVNISQSRTEQILDERIADQPLIETRWGYEVVNLDQDGDRVWARTGDGRTVTGGYAVLCAGAAAGALRTRLGVGFEGESFDDRFLICDIRSELPGWADERRFYFDPERNPGRQILIHPCPDSTFRIDWQVPGDYTLDTLRAEQAGGRLEARIRAIVGQRAYQVMWSSVYRFHSRCATRLRVGRVLLAGDAAHLVAPFGARGLNSGVADAENAAWKLGYVHNGWADARLLATYHDERHAAARENLAVTTDTMNFLVPRTPEHRARRSEVLERAAHHVPAHAEVDSGRFAEPFWYTASSLTTPDPRRPPAGRPARGERPPPAPGVLLPDAPIRHPRHRRLRELARDGLCLLHGTHADPAALAAARDAVRGPLAVHAVHVLDPGGALARALGLEPREVWVIRPDAHIAATLPDPTGNRVRTALRTALAQESAQESVPSSEQEERRGALPAAG